MIEKGKYEHLIEVLEAETINPSAVVLSREAQKKTPGVAVGTNRMRREIALLDRPIVETRAVTGAELVGVHERISLATQYLASITRSVSFRCQLEQLLGDGQVGEGRVQAFVSQVGHQVRQSRRGIDAFAIPVEPAVDDEGVTKSWIRGPHRP